MAGPRVILQPDAEADLDALALYIASRDGKARALHVLDRIDRTLRNLAFMPGMGRPKPYLEPGTLAFSSKPWTFHYKRLAGREGIRVLRIIDGRRDLPALFGKDGENP